MLFYCICRAKSGCDSTSSETSSDESAATDEPPKPQTKPSYKGRWTKEEVLKTHFELS